MGLLRFFSVRKKGLIRPWFQSILQNSLNGILQMTAIYCVNAHTVPTSTYETLVHEFRIILIG